MRFWTRRVALRGLRRQEIRILADLRHRVDPDVVVAALRQLQDQSGRVGDPQRFLDFWEECRADMGDVVVSSNGYQRSLGSWDSNQLRLELDSLISEVESVGPRVCLISGTLLGLVRDGELIEYDDDIDVAVLLPGDDLDPESRAEQWSTLRVRLCEAGLIDADYERYGRLHARAFTASGVPIDLFPAWVERGRTFVFPHTCGTLPESALRPFGVIEGLPVPASPTALLNSNYGSEWQVPDPLWRFDWAAARTSFRDIVTAWERVGTTPPRLPGRRLVLHCGALKTASTAVQEVLWRSRDDLAAAGVLYPVSGLMTSEPDAGMRHNRLIYAWQEDRAEFDETVEALVQEILSADPGTIVLSAESWSRPQFRLQLQALVENLRSRAGVTVVEAVIVFRNRQSHARSLYREYTARRRNTLECNEFLATERGWFDPLASLESLTAITDRVTAVPFRGDDTVERVLELLGVPSVVSSGGAGHGGSVLNASPSAIETEALRAVNRMAPAARGHWAGLGASFDNRTEVAQATEIIDPVPYQVDDHWRSRFSGLSGWPLAEVDRLLAWEPEVEANVAELTPTIANAVSRWAESELEETRVVHPSAGASVRLRRIETKVRSGGVHVAGVVIGLPTAAQLFIDVDDECIPVATRPPRSASLTGRRRFEVVLPRTESEARVLIRHVEQEPEEVGLLRRTWQLPT